MAEHRRLRLDPADAPAEHTQTVDHRRVRVGADERVGIDGLRLLVAEDRRREVLEVHLVDDAGAGRHRAEVLEGALPPAEEGVALLIPLELDRDVPPECFGRGERVDLDRVVDHQVDRLERVDPLRIPAELRDRVAHGGEVDDDGDAGEVLEEDARGRERDLAVAAGVGLPACKRLDVAARDRSAVLGAEEVLEQDPEREGEAVDVPDAGLRKRFETVHRPGAAGGGNAGAAVEAIERHGRPPRSETQGRNTAFPSLLPRAVAALGPFPGA
jgi:hypothetical protein